MSRCGWRYTGNATIDLDKQRRMSCSVKMMEGDSFVARINNHVIELLCQDCCYQILLIRWMTRCTQAWKRSLPTVNLIVRKLYIPESEEPYGLDLPTLAMLEDITDNILGIVLAMPIDDMTSEMTFYRRFSALLGYVVGGTDISMMDGEIVAEATRMALEQNDYDTTNMIGRKIDLLLKLRDTPIELASNEWKSNKIKHLKTQTAKQKSPGKLCNLE